MEQSKETKSVSKFNMWMKRVGVAGFFFFLIKGLIWLAIFFGIGKCMW